MMKTYLVVAGLLLAGTGVYAYAKTVEKPLSDTKAAATDCEALERFSDMGMGFGRHGRGGERMLRMMDKDGDGSISTDEAKARPLARFDLIDANRDGVATPEEIDAYVAEETKRLRAFMVSMLDANADGKISKEEASQAVDRRFGMMDDNKDGKIGREEMRGHMMKKPVQERVPQ